MLTRSAVCGLGIIALALLLASLDTPSAANATDPTTSRLATAEARVSALETAVADARSNAINLSRRVLVLTNQREGAVTLSEDVPSVPAPGEARINCDIIKSPFFGSDNPYNKDYTLICGP